MKLKYLRRAVQWFFFTLFFIGFLSFIPREGMGFLTILPKLQLFSMLQRAPYMVLIIFFVTFLFGRIYCSTLCPMATFQDILLHRKGKFSFQNSGFFMRYTVPVLSIIIAFIGFPAVASFVEPYSLTGRVVSSLNELVVLPLIDFIGLILRQFSVYITTYPIQFRWITIMSSVLSTGLVFLINRKKGRIFCNSLCPVGAILSIPARFSLYNNRIKQDKCTSCGACEKVCKARAISSEQKLIDVSRCISCFNCHDVCRFEALKFTTVRSKSTDSSRRDFLKKSTLGSLFLLGAPLALRSQDANDPEAVNSAAATPPGSKSRKHFLSKCTSCSLCISRCPGNVLQPAAFSQYGFRGTGTPYMDFNKGSCDYECNLCSRICPSGAIKPVELDTKKLIKIGNVKFVKEECVVEKDKTSCGACGEICPSGAIDMVHMGESPDGALEIPEIKEEYCIGCGACQFVCPVEKKNAIFVEALEPHERAELRDEESEITTEEVDNDFAF